MTLDNDLDILRRVALLRDFSHQQIQSLLLSGDRRRFSDHALVFAHDSIAEGGYVVMSGVIGKVVQGPAGPRLIERCAVGSLIDEYALMAPRERGVSAISLGPSEILLIRCALFRQIIAEDAALAALLHRRWSLQLSETTNQLAAAAQKFDPPKPE